MTKAEIKKLNQTKAKLKRLLYDIDASNKDNDAEIIKLISHINKIDDILDKEQKNNA